MNEKEIMLQVNVLSREALWAEIIKLLKAEEGFDRELSVELLSSLGYAYSKAAENLMKLNLPEALKYFFMQEELFFFLINDNRANAEMKLQCKRSLAYSYYALYSDTSLWSKSFRDKYYTAEVQSLVNKNNFKKDVLGNKALMLYWHLKDDDQQHVRTLYRSARLLEKMQTNISFSKGGWEKYRFDNGVNQLLQVLHINEVMVKDFICELNLNFFDEKRIELLEKAITVYKKLSKEQHDRWQNDYIKALYNSCVYYIKKVESYHAYHKTVLDTLDNWDLAKDDISTIPKWVAKPFMNKELVRTRLWEIMRLEKIPCNNIESQVDSLAQMDNAEQANFVFYRIADYIRVYKIARNESLEKNIEQCLKFYYYSALVDFQIVTNDAHDKSHFQEPYKKLGTLLAFLGMYDELHKLQSRFNLRDINYAYYFAVANACLKTHEGDFVKADAQIKSLEAMRVSKLEAKVVQELRSRFNHYKNNPELVEQCREEKNIAILLRNSLQTIFSV